MSLLRAEVVRKHSRKSPVFLKDFLDDDVDVLGLFTEGIDQARGEIRHESLLLFTGCPLGDLKIDVWHIAVSNTSSIRRKPRKAG